MYEVMVMSHLVAIVSTEMDESAACAELLNLLTVG